MIRNETEYKRAVERLQQEEVRMSEMRQRLADKGLTKDEIKRVIDPVESFHLQFKEEVESYEKLKRGEFDELTNLRGLGHLLISLRIARGFSQKDLAAALDVSESQVSRDERNEYHGITLDRANKVLDALEVQLSSKVEFQPFRKSA
jgi:DNA-binding Xre family transcriptional regulator